MERELEREVEAEWTQHSEEALRADHYLARDLPAREEMLQEPRRDALPHLAQTSVRHRRDDVRDDRLLRAHVDRDKPVGAARTRLLRCQAGQQGEIDGHLLLGGEGKVLRLRKVGLREGDLLDMRPRVGRSEEHTSELQSRI